jgi:hypothetical protein
MIGLMGLRNVGINCSVSVSVVLSRKFVPAQVYAAITDHSIELSHSDMR